MFEEYWKRSILFGDWIANINAVDFADLCLMIRAAIIKFPVLTNADFIIDGEFMRIKDSKNLGREK